MAILPGPFLVYFGAEAFLLDREVDRARHWKNRDITYLDTSTMKDGEVVEILDTPNMDGGQRLVILDEANKIKGDKDLKTYIESKDITDLSVLLFVILRTEKCPDMWAKAAKKGKLTEHKKLKPWGSPNDYVKWAEAEARLLKLTVESSRVEAICHLCGNDLYRISSELRKLKLLAGDKSVTKEMVGQVIAPALAAEPWQVAEAIVNRDKREAMNLLSTVYKTMGEEAHVPLAYSIVKSVEKLFVTRALLDSGMAEEDVAAALGVHPYRFRITLLPQAKKHTLAELSSHMKRLCDLDVEVKGSSKSKRTQVELAALTIVGTKPENV